MYHSIEFLFIIINCHLDIVINRYFHMVKYRSKKTISICPYQAVFSFPHSSICKNICRNCFIFWIIHKIIYKKCRIGAVKYILPFIIYNGWQNIRNKSQPIMKFSDIHAKWPSCIISMIIYHCFIFLIDICPFIHCIL